MENEPPAPSMYEEKMDQIGSINAESFAPRIARFLNPVAKTLNEPAPRMLKHTQHLNSQFKGWNSPPSQWPQWVDQMAGKYSSVWIKAGIFDSIVNSIYEIKFNRNIISALLEFWSSETNTFVFPWGEATVTLEDVMILGGFSVLGDYVDGVTLKADLAKKVEEMNLFRLELVRSKSKKALHSKWIDMFMSKHNKHEHEHEHEHVAFLSLWLSRFVFPSLDRNSIGNHVFPIAVKLSQGVKLALAPAVLASIYSNLTILKEQCVDVTNSCINLLGPFQLVQIWGYERLPIVGPETPNELYPGEPRLARWHGLSSDVSLPLLHSYIINPDNFIWRPYVVELKNWVQPSYYQDTEQIVSEFLNLDDDLLSFVRFLQPCELNSLSCKAKYLPHRVAMQFGFDQDIPDNILSYNSSKFVKVFVPSKSFQPGVSMRYSEWWKNVDGKKDWKNDQDSSLDEQMNKKIVAQTIYDLEDDDVVIGLKKIYNVKRRMLSELGNSKNEAIQID